MVMCIFHVVNIVYKFIMFVLKKLYALCTLHFEHRFIKHKYHNLQSDAYFILEGFIDLIVLGSF